jgi:hypothetical protein
MRARMLLALTLAPQLLPLPAAAAAALLLGPAAAAAGCCAAVRDRSMVSGLLHTGQVACRVAQQAHRHIQRYDHTYDMK